VLKDIAALPYESTKRKREKMETVPAGGLKFVSQQRWQRFQRARVMFHARIDPSLRPGFGSIRNNREHVAVEQINHLQFPNMERKQR
jgi:hypothetical protein